MHICVKLSITGVSLYLSRGYIHVVDRYFKNVIFFYTLRKSSFVYIQKLKDLETLHETSMTKTLLRLYSGWSLVDLSLFCGTAKYGIQCFYKGKMVRKSLNRKTYNK